MEGAAEAVFAAFDAKKDEIQGSFLIGRRPARFGGTFAVSELGIVGEASIGEEDDAVCMKKRLRGT